MKVGCFRLAVPKEGVGGSRAIGTTWHLRKLYPTHDSKNSSFCSSLLINLQLTFGIVERWFSDFYVHIVCCFSPHIDLNTHFKNFDRVQSSLDINAKMTEPYRLTASKALALMQKGDLTVEDYAKSLLARIKERDGVVKAWAYLDPEFVLAQAKKLDQKPPEKRGPLHGVAIGVKDVILTKGQPSQDSECVPRLTK
jgi:hypothetical protein